MDKYQIKLQKIRALFITSVVAGYDHLRRQALLHAAVDGRTRAGDAWAASDMLYIGMRRPCDH